MKTSILFPIFTTVLHSYVVNASKLMFILLDGFRWDYLDRPNVNLPGFARFMKNGVQAEYMTSVFPTFSIPNYYSAVTGLYAENHGMVNNDIYDEQSDGYFFLSDPATWYNPVFWNQAEPIWIRAEKQGKRVYMYHWIGCQVEIDGTKATFCAPYFYVNGSYPGVTYMSESINKGLDLLQQNYADVVGVYVENPDAYGHYFGPSADTLNRKLEEIDEVIGQMVTNITNKGLSNDVTVMIFSDHGMTEISPNRIVNITDYVDVNDMRAKIIGAGAGVNIWPKNDNMEKVYNALKEAQNDQGHFDVYRKHEIPEEYHYKYSDRISPIVPVAEPGWTILQPNAMSIPSIKGTHGYDPATEEMRGIFLASGPGLKENSKVSSIRIVDIYQLMCHILKISPAHHNGTWSHVSVMLGDTSTAVNSRTSITCVLLCVFVCLKTNFH